MRAEPEGREDPLTAAEQCRLPEQLCTARLCRVHRLTLSKLHLPPELVQTKKVRERDETEIALDERAAQEG